MTSMSYKANSSQICLSIYVTHTKSNLGFGRIQLYHAHRQIEFSWFPWCKLSDKIIILSLNHIIG